MSSNPKILLVNPPADCVNDDRVEPPLGILYIASNAIAQGYHDLSIYDMSGCRSPEDISKAMENIPESDIYGINSFCTNYHFAKQIIRNVHSRDKGAYIVIGGPNPSGVPEFTLQDSGADAVVKGEGEDALKYCIDSYVDGNRLTGIIPGAGREDIDSYPFPARDLVNIDTYSRKLMGSQVISMLSSRGCKYHCIHCNSVVMGGGNKKVRYRSPDNVMQEMRSLRGDYAHFRFNDDHFTGHPHLEELLCKIKELDITFRAFARLEDLTEKNSKMLKEAGCIFVSVGLESLDPVNLKIIGKSSQLDHLGNLKIAKENGLLVRSSYMVGLPNDSDENIEKYFTMTAELGVDEYAVYPLIPYPGTKIAEHPERWGYEIVNEDFVDYVQMGIGGRTCFALKHKNFTPEDVIRWKEMVGKILESKGSKHMSNSAVAT